MVEKFGKSWMLLIYLSRFVSLLTDGIVAQSRKITRGRLPGSTLIICPSKYFSTKILRVKIAKLSPFLGL